MTRLAFALLLVALATPAAAQDRKDFYLTMMFHYDYRGPTSTQSIAMSFYDCSVAADKINNDAAYGLAHWTPDDRVSPRPPVRVTAICSNRSPP
jgi:hypothetical protein